MCMDHCQIILDKNGNLSTYHCKNKMCSDKFESQISKEFKISKEFYLKMLFVILTIGTIIFVSNVL